MPLDLMAGVGWAAAVLWLRPRPVALGGRYARAGLGGALLIAGKPLLAAHLPLLHHATIIR